MRDRLGRSCPDPIGGQALGGGALTMPIRVFLVTMYYTQSFGCQRGVGENGVMSEPRPTLQFDLDLEAVRLLHRSVSFHLEKWPCLLYTSPSPRDVEESRMPSSA